MKPWRPGPVEIILKGDISIISAVFNMSGIAFGIDYKYVVFNVQPFNRGVFNTTIINTESKAAIINYGIV